MSRSSGSDRRPGSTGGLSFVALGTTLGAAEDPTTNPWVVIMDGQESGRALGVVSAARLASADSRGRIDALLADLHPTLEAFVAPEHWPPDAEEAAERLIRHATDNGLQAAFLDVDTLVQIFPPDERPPRRPKGRAEDLQPQEIYSPDDPAPPRPK